MALHRIRDTPHGRMCRNILMRRPVVIQDLDKLEPRVRLRIWHLAVLFASVVGPGAGWAQQPAPQQRAPAEQGAACPPDVKGEPPTVGGGNSKPLSDKLAESKGVICPPAGVDREMQVKPPAGGELKVIPPPGSPGGDRSIEPR
jgi:hypothetical protein